MEILVTGAKPDPLNPVTIDKYEEKNIGQELGGRRYPSNCAITRYGDGEAESAEN